MFLDAQRGRGAARRVEVGGRGAGVVERRERGGGHRNYGYGRNQRSTWYGGRGLSRGGRGFGRGGLGGRGGVGGRGRGGRGGRGGFRGNFVLRIGNFYLSSA